MKRTRAFRRFQLQKKKNKAKKYYGGWMVNPKDIGMSARTPKHCSCYACGNPRKHWGEKTIQEKRELQ